MGEVEGEWLTGWLLPSVAGCSSVDVARCPSVDDAARGAGIVVCGPLFTFTFTFTFPSIPPSRPIPGERSLSPRDPRF